MAICDVFLNPGITPSPGSRRLVKTPAASHPLTQGGEGGGSFRSAKRHDQLLHVQSYAYLHTYALPQGALAGRILLIGLRHPGLPVITMMDEHPVAEQQ